MKIFVFSRHFPCYNRISVTSNIKNSGLLVIIQDGDEENSAVRRKLRANRPFYRYGGHIEFIRFKEYYGMPRGHSLSIYARFSGRKAIMLYPNTGQRSFFSIIIFFLENLKKNWPEKRA